MGLLKRLFGGKEEPEEPAGVRARKLLRTDTDDLQTAEENLEEHNRIFDTIVERNLEGKRLEKEGKVDEAIELYEANVAELTDTPHPYERLRIIYRRRKEYGNCQATTRNGHR